MHIEVIRPGETVWTVSHRYGVPVQDIVRVNGLDRPERLAVGQAIVVPTQDRTHTVAPGETLWSIARKYDVTPREIAELNGIADPALVYPGMVLRIPQRPKRTIEANGYLQPGNAEQDRRIVRSVADALTYISFFSYRVDRGGNLLPLSDEAALEAVRGTNAVPMMVISNFEAGTFSPDVAHAILTDAGVRENVIRNVLNVMEQKGFFALNIDFEHIRAEDRERYNDFLREITPRVKQRGHLVSTALAPKTRADQPGEWYAGHDYAAHGRIVDFVILMTYEWGWSGGPPMAVAPIPQVRQVLDYAVSVIPRDKILMGAPLYGYDWTLPYVKGGPFARSAGPKELAELAYLVNARIEYDNTAQAPYFHYYDANGREHVVWFEDARSMQAKFDLIKEYGLRGISYWLLGNDFPQNWALLKDNFNIRKYR